MFMLDKNEFVDPALLPKHPIFLIIGDFETATARSALRRYPKGRVIIYEASRRNFGMLQKAIMKTHAKLGRTSGIVAHQKAVTGVDSTVTFNEYATPKADSVFKRKGREFVREYQVASVSIATVLSENNIDRIDAMIVNCEGAELGIMDELIANPQLPVKQICLSFHERKIYPEGARELYTKSMQDSGYSLYERPNSSFSLFSK